MSDPGGSDQKSFIEIGVPAVQVFTGAHADYHQAGDTADKIDGPGLVKVAAVTRELVAYLAERDQAVDLDARARRRRRARHRPRASAACRSAPIPDYAFAGPGVRITGTTPGSPPRRRA